MSHSTRAAAALSLAALLSACYQYAPATLEAVPPGAEVRVFMSRRALAEIPDDVPTSTTFVSGRIGRVDADSLLLQVLVSRRLDAPGAMDLRQNVLVPREEIVELQHRELNRPKTAMALLAGGALGTALLTVVVSAGGEPDAEQMPGPDQIRIPLFSLPVP